MHTQCSLINPALRITGATSNPAIYGTGRVLHVRACYAARRKQSPSQVPRRKCPSIRFFVLSTCLYFAIAEVEVVVAKRKCGNTRLHELIIYRSRRDYSFSELLRAKEHLLLDRKDYMELLNLEGHLITHPEEMYQEDCVGMTPVHYLVESRYIKNLLMAFINADFNSNHRFDKVNTIIFHAVKHGHLDTITTLVEFGSFVDTDNHDGSTPLFEAVKGMREDVCKLLLKNGANIKRSLSGGDGYLHRFVNNGTTEQVNLLVKLGAPMDVKNKQGLTPIDIAIQRDRIAMVNVFLIRSGNCIKRSKLWKEPLAFAVSNGTYLVLNLILSRIIKETCLPINYFKDAFYRAIKESNLGALNLIYPIGQKRDKVFLIQNPERDLVIDAIEYNSTISLGWLLKKKTAIRSYELKDYFQRIVLIHNMEMIKMLMHHRPPLDTNEMNLLIDVASVSGSDAIKNYLVELKEKIGKTIVPNN